MKKTTVLFLLLLSLLTAIVGCMPLSRWRWDQGSLGSAWPVAGGSSRSTFSLTDGKFNGKLDSLWTRRLGDKPTSPLVILDATLVYSSSKKRIRQFDLATGVELAQFRLPGTAASTPNRLKDQLIISLGSRADRVASFSQGDRFADWSRRLVDPSQGLLVTPSVIVAASSAGLLIALNPNGGDTLWTRRIDGPIRARLVGDSSSVFVTGDNGTIYCLESRTGKQQWVQKLNSSVVATPALSNFLLVPTMSGEIVALNPDDGVIRWRETRSGALWGGAASADTICIVGSGAHGGEIVAVHTNDGRELWRQQLQGVVRATPSIIGSVVVAGTLRGWLYTCDRASGMKLDSLHLDGAIEQSVISDGTNIFVATARGTVAAFGEALSGWSTKSGGSASAQSQ